MKVSVREVRENISRLIDEVSSGKEVTITRNGTQVARLNAIRKPLPVEELQTLRKDNAVSPKKVRVALSWVRGE